MLWDRFTEQAKHAIYVAQEAAAVAGSSVVESRHLLLGVLYSAETIASQVLAQVGADWDAVREAVADPPAPEPASGDGMRLSEPAKRVIDRAYEEARSLGATWIDTGQLLLRLIRDEEISARLDAFQPPLNLLHLKGSYVRLEPSPAEAIPPEVCAWTSRLTPAVCLAGSVLLWLWLIDGEQTYRLIERLLAAQSFPADCVLSPMAARPPASLAPALPALLWTTIAAPGLFVALGVRCSKRWAAIEAFLLCRAAFGLALAVLLLTAKSWSPVPIAFKVVTKVAEPATAALCAAFLLFRSRGLFNVGHREGWRFLWRRGGWMLVTTALVEAIRLGLYTTLLR